MVDFMSNSSQNWSYSSTTTSPRNADHMDPFQIDPWFASHVLKTNPAALLEFHVGQPDYITISIHGVDI